MSGSLSDFYFKPLVLAAYASCLCLAYGLASCWVEPVNASTHRENLCSDVSYLSSAGTNTLVRFYFDRKYPCGRFANGDWWVSPGVSGRVTVERVTPERAGDSNGIEINPSSASRQGFDPRISGYDRTLNVSTPFQVEGVSSIIKTVSAETAAPKCRPCIQYAAVLTILAKPLRHSERYFRPGYFGISKTLYRFDTSDLAKLSSYSGKCCENLKNSDFSKLVKRFQGVQLDHLQGWVGRSIHPVENMPDYGASIATDNAVSVLRFLVDDFDPHLMQHKKAVVNYLQMGIDIASMAKGGVAWPANGGHGNGRKLPLVFAAYVLDRQDIRDLIPTTTFSEDEQVYYSHNANRSLYGSDCTDAEYWNRVINNKGPRDCRDPYGYVDGGGEEIGGAYQYCCTAKPWKYTALAVHLLDLEEMWNNPAFLNYVDRWVSHGVWSRPDPCAASNGSPDDYLAIYGAGPDGQCLTGAGRYLEKHGQNADGGHYQNEFGDAMWNAYRDSIRE